MPDHRAKNGSEPHVAVCVDKSRAYGRGVLQGVADYIELYGPWSLFIDSYSKGELDRSWLRRWKGDGILAQVGTRSVAERLLRSGIPCVEIWGKINVEILPHVVGDDLAIGRLAAEHLLQCELRNFAYCGYKGLWWSDKRFQGFSERLREAGFDCEHYSADRFDDDIATRVPSMWERNQKLLAEWVSQLPKPVGIMASTDPFAVQVLDACHRAQIAVPEEAAVIGVDNDEELCRLCDPPLSSVVINPRRVGYEGARLLHQLMTGAASADQVVPIYVPPLEVAARLSTDITAIDDKVVAEAVSFIRKHACEGIGSDDVARAVGRSRTTLYRLFDSTLSRSPSDEILRVQLDRVKSLLARTKDSLEEIAHCTGFSSAAYLSVAFKREIGMTPGEYRTSKQTRV
jgi:LacI family transcriptional regulator